MMKISQFCLQHIHSGLIITLGLKYLHSFHTDPELPSKLVKEDQFSVQIQSIRNRFVLDSGQKMKLNDYLGINLKNVTLNPLFSSFPNPAWFFYACLAFTSLDLFFLPFPSHSFSSKQPYI